MPFGSLILKWDERKGIDIIAKYPENIESKITRKTLIQIYNMHQYLIEEGVIWLHLDAINISSYFSGKNNPYYFILILNILENPEEFEEITRRFGQELLNNIEKEDLKDFLAKISKELNII